MADKFQFINFDKTVWREGMPLPLDAPLAGNDGLAPAETPAPRPAVNRRQVAKLLFCYLLLGLVLFDLFCWFWFGVSLAVYLVWDPAAYIVWFLALAWGWWASRETLRIWREP